MTSEKYQEKLINMIKAVGQELIDNSEILAQGDMPGTTEFNITINIPTMTDDFADSVPTITVTREYYSKNILKLQFPDLEDFIDEN